MSSFGGPGTKPATKPTPPQRGSFPLDHDGECKDVMTTYLTCINKVGGVNKPECRDLAKAYLACRMDRNLMARDDFKNLGFQPDLNQKQTSSTKDGPKDGEGGAPGELRW